MYRMNPYNRSTPRDRLDPRMLEKLSHEQHRDNNGGCGCDGREHHTHTEMRSACPITPQCGARNEMPNGCGCGCGYEPDGNMYPTDFNTTLAMVYSPLQEFQNLYCEEEALIAGTIFKELDKPFYGPKCHGGCHHE